MKNNLRKTLRSAGLITCACALLVSLAGCGTGETGTTSPSSGSDTTSSAQESSESREVKDLNGYKWSILTWWGTEDSCFNPVEGKSILDDYYLERNQKLMDDYNFEIEMKAQSLDTFYAAIMGAAMSGEKLADVIKLGFDGMQTLRIAEVLNPFDSTTMPEVDLNDEKWESAITKAATFGGKVYGITNERSGGIMCFFNSTMFEERNVTSPYDLYKEGKWTWEEFEKLAKQMTIDENGDGTPDIYGVGTVSWSSVHLEGGFIASNGGNAIKYDQNGVPTFAYTDNDAQEALEFVRNLYAEKVIIPDQPTSEADAATVFSNRKTAFMIESTGFTGWIKDMEDDFGMVPFPKGPSADDHTLMSLVIGLYVTTIGTSPQDYEASSLIFDLLTDPLPETGDPTIDDPTYSLRNEQFRDDDAVDIYLEMSDKVVICELINIPALHVLTSQAITSCVKDNATTPKAAMESIADQAQTLIDEFFTKKD